MFWVTCKDAQIVKNYGVKRDDYGKVVKVLASVERHKPDGGGTGKWDCIVVSFRMPFNPTLAEAQMCIEAHRLQPGETFSFEGNLHTNTDPVSGSFFASISGKGIDTAHQKDVAAYLKDWMSAKEERPVMKEAVAV